MVRFSRFLVIGACGFLIDSGLTQILIGAGVSAFLARIPAIFAAMIFTWLANRKYTFRVERNRSIYEVIRYSGVATTGAVLNYLVYLTLVMVSLTPFVAIMVASVVVAVLSYCLYKRLVFSLPANG
jgi:putative flippase GtrA